MLSGLLTISENFQIYVNVNTTAGQRYLTYTPATSDQLGTSTYVYFGIGSEAIKGQWHTFTRDLQADLERAQPGVTITQVNGMDIRGNLRIDDVMLLAQLPALDTESDGIPDDLETNVYGTDPSKADTNHCGISDGYKLDYLGSRWNQDTDGDGIINLLDDDMDNDGILDGDEITQRHRSAGSFSIASDSAKQNAPPIAPRRLRDYPGAVSDTNWQLISPRAEP